MEKVSSLGINYGPSQMVKLNTFGNNSPSNMHTNKTMLIIKKNDGTPKLEETYIDNLISGSLNKEEAIKYHQQTKEMFNAASMYVEF